MTNMTHYRKVYKSDHLGVADLEDLQEAGNNLVFTIKHVRQELGAKVAGKKIDANIAYFNEPIKPLVLNATNAGTLRKMTGSGYIENWANIPVQLYIDKNVKMKGDIVGGVRIHPKAPALQKPRLKQGTKQWENAKKAFIRDGNFIKILERAEMSEGDMQAMQQEVSQGV